MNVTFLIGNGFDLNLGFRTRYIDFLDNYYLSQDQSSDPRIKEFKGTLKADKESWADAELAFGKLTGLFKNESDFLYCHADFCRKLSEYLKKETSGMEFLFENELAKSFTMAMMTFFDNIQNFYKEKIVASCSRDCALDFYFINFNYTYTLDTYIDSISKDKHSFAQIELSRSLVHLSIQGKIHIHGTVDRDMILGVNDESQVDNIHFANSRKFRTPFLKQVANQRLHNLKTEQSSQYISDSDVICIFGMSLGETDRIWWEKIGDWLLEDTDHLLVIYEYRNSFNPILPNELITMEEDVQDKFFSYNEKFKTMSELEKEEMREQISVAINTDMFANLRNSTQYILNRPDPDLTTADV